jgi:hypothetical protein
VQAAGRLGGGRVEGMLCQVLLLGRLGMFSLFFLTYFDSQDDIKLYVGILNDI